MVSDLHSCGGNGPYRDPILPPGGLRDLLPGGLLAGPVEGALSLWPSFSCDLRAAILVPVNALSVSHVAPHYIISAGMRKLKLGSGSHVCHNEREEDIEDVVDLCAGVEDLAFPNLNLGPGGVNDTVTSDVKRDILQA